MDDVPLWGALLLQAVLITVNAFFAAAEIAIVSLNESKIRKEAEEGNKKAKLMLSMVETPTGFLSTIQVMITLAGFLGSAFAAESFSDELAGTIFKWFGGVGEVPSSLDTVAVILVTLILSYFTLVFGELVPKRIAMQRTEKVASGVCGVIRFFSVVAKPVVWFLSISTNAVLRILGIDPHHEEEVVTEDEIRLMVDISEESGEIEAEEKEMIENIFEFNNTTASEIMIHRTDIESVWVNESEEEILSIISRTGMSRFPVYDEDIDDIIGILFT
ncbi:MAG: DUF21 domain-containing protein, partial [Clostridiales bacterium]|nr:DUF21 domain-containing protein [Clostridiales bacterium]